ncbi:ABC transporter permease [Nocardiopsis alkaliphila]|uniref:ABC transporter permease n=1 Tax=Nocardiopsis alkaliphila TaxID=225762 RepID=UPI0003718930|nr:ABC transporter permease [Nocardiopsis alkaliphila]
MPRRTWSGPAPHRLPLRDLLSEAASGMLARPGRTALTGLGTVIGITVFVATLGLASTAAGQIGDRFDAMTATEVTVTDQSNVDDLPGGVEPGLGEDPEKAAMAVNGVTAAGSYFVPDIREPGGESAQGSLLPPGPPGTEPAGVSVDVLAVSPGYFDAVHARLAHGRVFDSFHEENTQPVAVLGRAAAHRIGLNGVEHRPTLFVGRHPFTVIGIVEDVERHPATLASVMVPRSSAMETWGAPEPGMGENTLIVDTRMGAAQQVGDEIRVALRPDHPAALQVQVPPDPRTLRDGIDNDLTGLFMALAVVCLGVGALGIANTTLVSVIERVPEIGLRRAMGARRSQIAAQFLTESAGSGFVGGMVGAALGAGTVVVVSLFQGWGPLLDPRTIAAAPLIGAGVGLVAGAYPAWRAARTEPAQALRS